MENNFIGLLDQKYLGDTITLTFSTRSNKSQKRVDFSPLYWHENCVRKKVNFSWIKSEKIYDS